MAKPKNIFKYKIPIYGGSLSVCVSDDYEADIQRFKVGFDAKETRGASALAFRIEDGRAWGVLIDPTPSIADVVHESVHIANFIFLDVGAELDIENDEPYAYLTAWIADRVRYSVEKLRKLKVKDENKISPNTNEREGVGNGKPRREKPNNNKGS